MGVQRGHKRPSSQSWTSHTWRRPSVLVWGQTGSTKAHGGCAAQGAAAAGQEPYHQYLHSPHALMLLGQPSAKWLCKTARPQSLFPAATAAGATEHKIKVTGVSSVCEDLSTTSLAAAGQQIGVSGAAGHSALARHPPSDECDCAAAATDQAVQLDSCCTQPYTYLTAAQHCSVALPNQKQH